MNYDLNYLIEKRNWVWKETLLLHKRSPDTRIASCLSPIEIFICLYYGGILKFDSKNPHWINRDRFVISKGHGSVSMYPILADLGYFNISELENIGKKGSILGGIPDPIIPGYETVNGSLGHGLGVAAGMALYLKKKESSSKVFVIVGDGELYEGSNWEAIMFASQQRLDNLILIVDCNKVSMLDFCDKIIKLNPIAEKLKTFNWNATDIDGHDISEVFKSLFNAKNKKHENPSAIIANTIKGKGIKELEINSLSHVISLSPERIDELIKGCPL